jgi:hypothetical protein
MTLCLSFFLSRTHSSLAVACCLLLLLLLFLLRQQKDLVRRLRKVCHVLRSDAAVEAHSEEWPGLARLAQHLAAPELLAHATPTVRLLTSVACMEIFAIVRSLLVVAFVCLFVLLICVLLICVDSLLLLFLSLTPCHVP